MRERVAGRRLVLASVAIGLAAVIVYGRTAGYGLYADDFQWLVGAQLFDPGRLIDVTHRNHFFRPVVELYFPAALAACGTSAPCFHWLSIGLHLVTCLAVAALVVSISGNWFVGALTGVLFAVMPGPTEAVAWVSAVSEVIATLFFVATIWLFWLALTTAARGAYFAALLTFLACLLAHESGVALLPVLALSMFLLPPAGPTRAALPRRILMLAPFAILLAMYAVVAYVVNSRNYLVTEGRYDIGLHMLPNMLDSLVTLAVARRDLLTLAVVAVVFLWAALATPPRVRFFALWTLIALAPFAGFRGGLSSRYLYLPAVGFAALTAEALWWGRDALRRWPRAGLVLWSIATIVVTLRFGLFAVRNVRTLEQASAPFSEYAASVRRLNPAPARGARLEVPPPPREVSPHFVPALLQWEFQDATLTPVVANP